MSASIRSIGLALPTGTASQTRYAEMTARARGLDDEQTRRNHVLYKRSTVRQRASVLLDESGSGWPYPIATTEHDRGPTTGERLREYLPLALDLSERACRGALEQTDPRAVTHLINVTCTGFAAPGVDLGLIERLGLNSTVHRLQVGFMGCHGAINGLAAARAFAEADHDAVVLLNAAELCSLHFSYDERHTLGNAIFADGAAACVVAHADTPADWALVDSASTVISGTTGDMGWTIGDHGFEMTLSREVPDAIEHAIGPWMSRWLAKHNLSIGDINAWAVHPGGPKILDAVQRSLNLAPNALDTSRAVLADHGNMSSPTVLFVLDRLRRAGASPPAVLLAFGPGLVAEAALLNCSS